MKNLKESMRPVKHAEIAHRPYGTNMIAKVRVTAAGAEIVEVGSQIATSPLFTLGADTGRQDIISPLLQSQITPQRPSLLWAYGDEHNQTIVVFGYDMNVNFHGQQVKIGHVALMSRAHISGEIKLVPATNGIWSIDNESGAWGGMGNESGKTKKLVEVAAFMSRACNMQVRAKKAFSKNKAKRWIQHQYPQEFAS